MVESFPTADALADAAAGAVVEALRAGLSARPRASLVATGGRSPAPVYDRLASAELDWSCVDVTLSDDRCVAADDPASNEGLVRSRLLTGRASAARFIPLVRPSVEVAEAEVAALAPFDVMLLGMGEDGHVASLIPGSPVLAEGMATDNPRLLINVPAGVGSPPLARVSLTLAALLKARLTLVLISGAAKRSIVDTGVNMPVHVLLEQAKSPVRVLWTP